MKPPREGTQVSFSAAQRRAFRRRLLKWFGAARRDLPWRTARDPYRVWISEIMLQQTRVETVVPYFERFMRALPSVASLAAAPEGRVLKLWEGLGYYARARNLRRAAQIVVAQFDGVFPTTIDELRTLPGVGRYTAAAVASICAGAPVAVVDGNVKRVLSRLFAIEASIDDRAIEAEMWRIADELVTPSRPGDHNEAMMELGATICLPRGPTCVVCPLQQHCQAFARGQQEELPTRAKKRAIPTEYWVAASVVHRGRTLIEQRPTKGLFASMWDLPNVVVADKRSGRGQLLTFLRDQWGIESREIRKAGVVEHVLTHKRISMGVFSVVPVEPVAVLKSRSANAKWAHLPSPHASMSVLMQKALQLDSAVSLDS